MTTPEDHEQGPCFLCGKPDQSSGSYCFGCEQYICEDCDLNPLLMGAHEPYQHQDEDL